MSLLKKGAGFWILSGSNTFSGATTVEEGTLRVATGSNLANQAVTIRHRDSMAQERVPVDGIRRAILDRLDAARREASGG